MSYGSSDMKILIVDDFPTMRRIVKTLLRQNGYNNFVEAEDGIQGLKVLNEHSDVSLVIGDWNMPNMGGLDFLKAVRKSDKFSNTPFLMVAAEAEKEFMLEAIKNGANNFIVKPFTGGALQEKIIKSFSASNRKAG